MRHPARRLPVTILASALALLTAVPALPVTAADAVVPVAPAAAGVPSGTAASAGFGSLLDTARTGLASLGAVAADAGETLAGAGTDAGLTLGGLAQTAADVGVASILGPCGKWGSPSPGDDGRYTILLIGSDYREHRKGRPNSHYIGERTDILIIATRKANGDVAVASIPRDTVYFPRAASNGGGTSGTNRVNAMYSIYYKRYGKYGPTEVDCAGMDRFRADVATALGTEIDYWAMVRMIPFSQLVDSVGYVKVDVPGPIIDTYYGHHGVYFPNATDYTLQGNDACGPKPKKCHSGLAYVRSRHGTQAGSANNDFKRAYRQHDFIFAATQRVVERGNGTNLRNLMEAIRPKVFTSLPKTWDSMTVIYDLLKGIRMKPSDRVILGPSTYAYTDSTTPIYTFRMRLDKVRAWIDDHFGS